MELNYSHILETVMDNTNRGLLCVDQENRIVICNSKCKSITGIAVNSPAEHPEGMIECGDIIIIADNMFNGDDGHIGEDGLSLLNVHDPNIRDDDIFLCVAAYNNPEIKPIYKVLRERQINNIAILNTTYFGFDITALVNATTKEATISVNGTSYTMHYYHNICNVVVIDGKNGNIKFVQALGYSVRKEGAGDLLRNRHFRAKSANSEALSIEGKVITELFDSEELLNDIDLIISRRIPRINDRLYRINQIPYIADIIPWYSEDQKEILGTYVLLTNIDDLTSSVEHGKTIIKEVTDYEIIPTSFKNFPIHEFKGITGRSPLMVEVKYLAYKASKNSFTVTITGESGTGKSMLAREIHRLWNPSAPFVEVNCNAISPSLFESELFGYVKGAFTGAKSEGKVGFFEAANGGTIFLDEIGDLPMDIQIKLLQVLQNKVIYRVGSTKPTKINVRVIVATNQNLKEKISNGQFRSDLYYRINVFPIELPPLRDRQGDLYLLINSILTSSCEAYGMETKQLSEESIHQLLSYSWPGNVRELENVIERAITLCESNMIYPEHLRLEHSQNPVTMKALLAIQESKILENTLLKFNGDKEQAMKELDMSRSVFYQRLKLYHLT